MSEIETPASANREALVVDLSTITPGTTVEGTVAGRTADGRPIARTIRVTVDRTPWTSADGRNVILATAKGVDAVVAETLRIVTPDTTLTALVLAEEQVCAGYVTARKSMIRLATRMASLYRLTVEQPCRADYRAALIDLGRLGLVK
jgi:hypothetical protein